MFKKLSLSELLPLLSVPVSNLPLTLNENGNELTGGDARYPIVNNKAVLYRKEIMKFFTGKGIHVPLTEENVLDYQYYLLSSIKQNLPQRNSPITDKWYEFHLECSAGLLSDASGSMLDIGCDSDSSARKIFPKAVEYAGLDVCVSNDNEFQVVGMAEALPFKDESFDNVALMTSLDHVLDYKTAMIEAYRVLKRGGHLYLASLVWYDNFDLSKDINHFHHFSEAQILDCLTPFKIQSTKKYDWKEGGFRQSMYLKARK